MARKITRRARPDLARVWVPKRHASLLKDVCRKLAGKGGDALAKKVSLLLRDRGKNLKAVAASATTLLQLVHDDVASRAVTAPIRVGDELQVGRYGIVYVDPEFKAEFESLVVAPRSSRTLAGHRLQRNASNKSIRRALEYLAQLEETDPADIITLLSLQLAWSEGNPEPLSNWNVFYMKNSLGVFRAVILYFAVGWGLYSRSIMNPTHLHVGSRVVSCKPACQ